MKLRGPDKISRTKTIPFLLVAIFLVLLGLILIAEGLLIDFLWGYSIEIFYRPYWLGALVVVAGSFILLFCCLRTPAVSVVVTTVCLPALAGSIIMLVFTTLMTEALIPDNENFFCSSEAVATNTVYCSCVQEISFNVTVKSTASNATVNDSCEDEMSFIFDLMLVTAGVCGLLVILLFTYISWVFCAATRPTYAERRKSAFNGTMPRSGTLIHGGGMHGTLIVNNTTDRPRTSSRAQSVSSGFRPVVTVQSSPPPPQPAQPRTGTLKTTKAPTPPQTTPVEPVYSNIEQDPVRAAEQQRFEIPSDIHGQTDTPPTDKGEETPPDTTPPDIPAVEEENSSEDNTTEVTHSFKQPPKQISAVESKIQNLEQNLNFPGYGKSR